MLQKHALRRAYGKFKILGLFLTASALTSNVLLIGLSAARAAEIAPSAQTTDPLRLTVVAPQSPDKREKDNVGWASYDFGEITPEKTFPVKHTFVLRNDNKTPLTVIDLKPSCQCTQGGISQEEGAKPVVINPGKQIQVWVGVDPQRLHHGEVTETVAIMVKEQATPAAMLGMHGSMDTGISYTPSILDFGNYRKGSQPSLSLVAMVNRNFGPALPDFHLISSNPDIIAGEPVIDMVGVGQRKISYVIKVSPHAHPGPLTGDLYFLVPSSNEPIIRVFVHGNVSD